MGIDIIKIDCCGSHPSKTTTMLGGKAPARAAGESQLKTSQLSQQLSFSCDQVLTSHIIGVKSDHTSTIQDSDVEARCC